MGKKTKIIIILITALIFMTILGVVLKKEIDKNLNQDFVITINSEEIILNKQNKNQSIDLLTLNSENDVIISKKQGNAKIKVNGKILKDNEELNLGKIDINKESKIIIEVTYINMQKIEFVVNTLPSIFPEYKAEGESKYDGDYYMSTYSFEYDDNHYIFKTNKKGEITYYKKTNMVSFDFKKETNKLGETRYMYLEATAIAFEGTTSLLPCDLVIMNEEYKEIERVKYLDKEGNYISLENHTYHYIDDGHYILATYKNRKKEIEGKTVYLSDCLIEEIKDGKILWEFDSGEYPELYRASTVGEEMNSFVKKYKDYIHINSIWVDEKDKNIICSFRNIDGLLKIDRKTGKIIWTLGGKLDEFGLNKEQKFSKQHSAIHIGNDTILIYDNGNEKGRSRIVKIKINEENKKVIEYKDYDLGVYAYMMGSVRALDKETETYLICYGGGNYTKDSVEEINFSTGDVDFKFTFIENRMMYNANKMR